MSEKIIDKLRKLMKHEESARTIGNLNEAENFASKVQDLLMKYKLSVTDIQIEEEAVVDDLTVEIITPGSLKNRAVRWHSVLLTGICRANNCDCSSETGSNRLTIYGYETDIALCFTLFKYFVGLGEQLSMVDYIKVSPDERPNHWRDSWLNGYAKALRVRFMNAHYDAIRTAKQAESTSTALMRLDNKDAMVKEFVKHFGLTKVRSKTTINAAYQRGHETGSSVALTDKKIER